jgi:hypothetical protein
VVVCSPWQSSLPSLVRFYNFPFNEIKQQIMRFS